MYIGSLISRKKALRNFVLTDQVTLKYNFPIYISKNKKYKIFLAKEQEITSVYDINVIGGIWLENNFF